MDDPHDEDRTIVELQNLIVDARIKLEGSPINQLKAARDSLERLNESLARLLIAEEEALRDLKDKLHSPRSDD